MLLFKRFTSCLFSKFNIVKFTNIILHLNKTITDFGLNEIIKSLKKIVLIDINIKSIGGSLSQITQKY
jgi:hypothetical protein